MASTLTDSRRLLQLARSPNPCSQWRRAFSATTLRRSGHNKWSKIKHTKGREDQKKTADRTMHAQAITLYSKLYGANPEMNGPLASAITLAKKASTPKHVIEQAIARGQGRSLSGTALESMKFEVMVGSNAFIIDVETDNKLRALQDIGGAIRKHKGRTAATEFFFSRLGRVVFEQRKEIAFNHVVDEAIELGAEDLEVDDEGNIVIWSQTAQTIQIAQGVAKAYGLNVLSSEIIWSPNGDTRSIVDSVEDVKKLSEFVNALSDFPEVNAIYSNAVRGTNIPDLEWAAFEDLVFL